MQNEERSRLEPGEGEDTPAIKEAKMEQEERRPWKPKNHGVTKRRRWQMLQKNQAIKPKQAIANWIWQSKLMNDIHRLVSVEQWEWRTDCSG